MAMSPRATAPWTSKSPSIGEGTNLWDKYIATVYLSHKIVPATIMYHYCRDYRRMIHISMIICMIIKELFRIFSWDKYGKVKKAMESHIFLKADQLKKTFSRVILSCQTVCLHEPLR